MVQNTSAALLSDLSCGSALTNSNTVHQISNNDVLISSKILTLQAVLDPPPFCYLMQFNFWMLRTMNIQVSLKVY